MIIRKGSCHCGTVQFEVEMPDEKLPGARCNCSICALKGAVMIYVPLAAVTVTSGQGALHCYSFNTGVAKHHFCVKCGIHCFHQTRSAPDKYDINAATLEGVCPYADFPDVEVNDGARHVRDTGVQTNVGRLRFEPTS